MVEINPIFTAVIFIMGFIINYFILMSTYKANKRISDLIMKGDLAIFSVIMYTITLRWSYLICALLWLLPCINLSFKLKKDLAYLKKYQIQDLLDKHNKDIKYNKKIVSNLTTKLESDCQNKSEKKYELEKYKNKILSSRFIISKVENKTNKLDKLSTRDALGILFNPIYYNE